MSKKENFDSISSFFKISGYNHLVFDLSRRVYQLTNKQFEKAEQQKEVYPSPFKQNAYLGLLFWHPKRPEEPIIWFLKFPIDELGYIDLAARDGFLNQLLNQFGENLIAQQDGESLSDTLKESPFAFKPQQDKMAMFHAIATRELCLSPSQYLQPTLDYLDGKLGYDQWAFLGLQGIADVIARLKQHNYESILAKAIEHLPDTPLTTFSQMLEHTQPSQKLTLQLIKRLEQAQTKQDDTLIPHLVRSLSCSEPYQLRHEALENLLINYQGEAQVEVMAAIAGRAWESLQYKNLMATYLQRLSTLDQAIFDTILDELMLMKDMREVIMTEFRSEKRSEQLSQRISGYMGRFTH